MSDRRIKCRKGDPCRFQVGISTGIDAAFTRAKFQVRDGWDETLPTLLAVDETNGITITPGTPGTVDVVIGASATEGLPVLRQSREAAAQLRLYHGTDADQTFSFPIPFLLLPEVIVDGA